MSQNSINQGYSSFFCLLVEGSGCGAGSGSGSDPGGPKTYGILRIRIRNTGFDHLIPGEGLLCPACRAWVQTILPPQLANGKQLYPAVTK
jgi:hypothetical protein